MKLKKLFAFLTTGVIALSTMSVSVSAEETVSINTSNTRENISVLFEGDIEKNDSMQFSPFELGKCIDNSQIRITLRSDKPVGWGIFGVSGQRKSTGSWVDGGVYYLSEGEGKYTTFVFDYKDFVNQMGIGDDFAFFVFQYWGVSYAKIELLTPKVSEKVDILYDGKINLTEFTPEQLGKNIDGAKIRITYTGNKPSCWGVLGISGKTKNTWKWIQNKYAFLSKGQNVEITNTFSYNDFVNYIGIGDNVECFVFQDWGLAKDENVLIELITPDESENVTVIYDDVIELWESVEFTPQQLGKGIDGAKLRFTYYSAADKPDGSKVIGIAGKANDKVHTWLQSETNPALTTDGYGVENVQEIYYDELVVLADIGTNVYSYVFSNWGLDPNQNLKIELIVPYV